MKMGYVMLTGFRKYHAMCEYERTAVKLSENMMRWLTLLYSPIMPAIPLTTLLEGVTSKLYRLRI